MYVNGLTGHHFYCCQRPTAKELLRHHFIRRAKRTAHLGELIEILEPLLQDLPEEDRPKSLVQ